MRSFAFKRFYSTPSYFVQRTANKGLPVYTDYKNGRTRVLTVIRKVQGDTSALLNDIKKDFPEAQMEINRKTQHLIVKGRCMNEMKEWLISKGF